MARFNGNASVNLSCLELLREIFWISVVHNGYDTARFIPGSHSVIADRLSRLFPSVPNCDLQKFSLNVAVTDELALLDRRVADVISSAWSDNTLADRNSQWKRYFHFCHDFGLTELPATVSTVARFLVHLGQDVRYSTVNNYVSAVIGLHRFYGYEIDFRSYYVIKLVLKGLKCLDVEGSRAKIPFTLLQLNLIYVLHVTTEFDQMCWLSVIICVRTPLRKSNVLPSSSHYLHIIRRSDVEIYPGL